MPQNSQAYAAKLFGDITHNTKIKQYNNGLCKVTVCSKKVFREAGWETRSTSGDDNSPSKPKNLDNPTRADSLYRSKKQVFDIVYQNGFDYFVTLTLNDEMIDRFDRDVVMKKFKIFLNNMVKRYSLKYIFIPEYHNNGAIHLHGLISGDIKIVDSGTRIVSGYSKPIKLETMIKKHISSDGCKIVYNLPQWSYGYSTAIATYGNTDNLSKYMTKYCTKETSRIFGNYYYAGGHIVRDVPFKLCDTDFESFESSYSVYCEEIDAVFKYSEYMKGENN